MKRALAIVLTMGFTLVAVVLIFSNKSQAQNSAQGKNQKAVIVELFTSEGCSSCPPADALLLKLENGQPVEGAKIIALEEHVDYWNSQGWTDPFSSVEWTSRQQEYSTRLKENGVYTPQMIVDGETEVVGSRELEATQAIKYSATQNKTEVTLAAGPTASDGAQQFKVCVGNVTGNAGRDVAEVWLGISERQLESAVGAGENAGRDLHHAAVLRTLHKIGVATAKSGASCDFEATPTVKFKASWKRQNLQAVVFVQEKKSLRILGAASVDVTN